MQDPSADVKAYFDQVPLEWDALYSNENRFRYAFNRVFRKALYDRYRLTFEEAGEIKGQSVLDIGCGTGRFSIEFAKCGASRVVGIDIAPSMVEFSRRVAKEMNVDSRCKFVVGDFLEVPLDPHYDIVAAQGFFDYTADSASMFARIASLKPRKFLASFPYETPIWGIQRRIRYHYIKKCPIFSYTEERLSKMYEAAGFPNYRIVSIGGGMGGLGLFGIAGF
jgi:ubiquinone/menaquinone biosynthesis C-methylase UbiE